MLQAHRAAQVAEMSMHLSVVPVRCQVCRLGGGVGGGGLEYVGL